MSDNTDIDSRILAQLAKGETRNMSIHFGDDELKKLHFRAIDRRLQALRKAGKIVFSHKTGWSAV